MSEKKELNQEKLEKVTGGDPKYQEGWKVFAIYKNYMRCPNCKKTVDVIEYKEAMYCGYCAICHDSITGLD